MVNLIQQVRNLANVAIADWPDNDVQISLDKHRLEVRREQLTVEPEYTGGTAFYYDYFSTYGNFEEYGSANAYIFDLTDSDGNAKGTADWTANYINGHVRFSVDQGGTAIFLTGRSYDLYGAAAEICRQHAAVQAAKYSFTADDTTLHRSHWFDHYMKLADLYDKMARPVVVSMVRSDVNSS
jgi:hypothetical protein